MMATDKFSEQDLEHAVDRLATMRFPFPFESRGAVMAELAAMCPSRTALRWLVNEVTAHVAVWPGLAELRGILCTRYDAADGLDQWSTLPGYCADDAEARYIAQRPVIDRLADTRQLRQLAAVKVRTLQ